MRRLLFHSMLILTGLLLIAFTAEKGCAASQVHKVSKEELRDMLDNPDVVVIDLRSDADWQSSDIKVRRAVREDPADVKGWARKYSKDKTMALYCA